MNFSRKLLSHTLSLALACTLSPTGFATSHFSSISQSESQEEILENLRKHVAKYYYELSPEEQELSLIHISSAFAFSASAFAFSAARLAWILLLVRRNCATSGIRAGQTYAQEPHSMQSIAPHLTLSSRSFALP